MEDRMIRVRFPNQLDETVTFGRSPLLECVLSLHVLAAPNRYAVHGGWLRRSRSLSRSLRRHIDELSFAYRRHLPDLVMPVPGNLAVIEDELERLVSHPPQVLLPAFGRPLFDHGGEPGELFDDEAVHATMLSRAQALGPGPARTARLLLDDPRAFAARFAELVDDYWRAAFAAEWRRIEPALESAATAARAALRQLGPALVFGRLPAGWRWHERELVADLPHHHTLAPDASRPIGFVPSVFVAPHLRVNCDAPWPAALVYRAAAAGKPSTRVPPGELLVGLRALADDTRLRVLRLLAEEPRSTQELAPLAGLSQAGLSKALRRLADAGLVTTHRDGYYVLYELVPERAAAVTDAVARYLQA
jgi:DNA-binding transcriptional ArsR family regulator